MGTYLSLQDLYYRDSSTKRDVNISAEAQKRQDDQSTFKTGIAVESGELFLAVPRELSIINERLFRVERKVSQLWHELPGIAQWAYLRGLIMSEIVSTNEIEGVHSTRRQIEEALVSAEAKTPPKEYKRFKEFANLYLELTNNDHVYPKKPADIRKIYDAVVAGELAEKDQPDGELFRKETVDIINSSQKVLHSGVSPESAIIDMLEQMIALVESPEMPSIFSAIIAHYLFEYVHPFYDGNGRTGRYLLSLYLSEPLSLATVLSMSSIISENKTKYYKAFTTAETALNQAEVTFFVIQIMKFIRLAQDSVIENLENKKALLKRAEESLADFKKEPYLLSGKEIDVLYQAVQHYLFAAFPEILLSDIARNSDVGAQTARKYTIKLEEKSLLNAVSLKPLKFTLATNALRVFDIA